MDALNGMKALLSSEKAIAGGVLVVCATVLVGLGQMTIDQWSDYTQVIFGAYVVGKTAQGVATTMANRPAAPIVPEPKTKKEK